VDGFRFGTGSTGRKRESSMLVCNAKDRKPKGSRSDSEVSRTKTAVIVGGGPAGLAAALVLSNISNNISNTTTTTTGTRTEESERQNLFERVIVLEDAPKESYDPSRAYFYNINKRGQRFTDAFDIDLTKRGLEVTGFAKLVVPSDPAEAFDETKVVRQQLSEEERKRVGTMYWIPRHELVEEIVEEIQAKNKKKGGTHTQIELRRGVRCKHVEPTKEGMVRIVTVTATESSGDDDQEDCLVADLCVGADGISSGVRQSLEDGRFDPEHWSNAQNPSKKFGLKKYTTPSTGLRIKGLRIRPNFAIPKGGTGPDARTKIPLEARYNYGLRSATTGPTDSMNLIFLPQKDPDSKGGRSVNICTLPDHDIWDETKLRTDDGGRSAKAYFEKAFPRFDWNEIVAGDEWELFASTEGSRFPQCQYSPSLYVASKQPCPEDGDACNHRGIGAGVVLIGDALHSFPPDLGQGVNSAFCDAMVLGKCFEDAAATTISVVKETTAESKIAKPSLIAEALRAYETRNGPETRALIALARCGAPYQYDQASFRMRLGKKLWTANVVLRLLLNKVTGGLSPKPAILMMMDSRSSFRRIMRRANTLTAILWSSVVVFAVALARLRLRLSV